MVSTRSKENREKKSGPTDPKLERPLRNLARDFLLEKVDPGEQEAFLDEITDRLEHIRSMAQAIMKGEEIYRRPKDRRRDLKSTFHLAAALGNRLKGLDPRSALSLMGPLEGLPVALQCSGDDNEPEASVALRRTMTWGVTSRRLEEYERWTEHLLRVRDNAWALYSREKPNQPGAPPTSDVVVFGISALAGLWRECRRAEMSSSQKPGQFGLFVILFYQGLNLFPKDSPVLTCLRKFVADCKKADSYRRLDHQID